jgi:hypothetical protein
MLRHYTEKGLLVAYKNKPKPSPGVITRACGCYHPRLELAVAQLNWWEVGFGAKVEVLG